MKEYIKPTAEVISIKVSENIAADPFVAGGTTLEGDQMITIYNGVKGGSGAAKPTAKPGV